MFFLFFKRYIIFVKPHHLPVDPKPHVAISPNSRYNILMLAFSPTYNGSHHYYLCSFFFLVNFSHYGVDRLTAYLSSTNRAVRNAYPCIKKSQIIVYLSYGSDRRSRILACCLLIYRNCRRKTFNGFNVRFFHHSKELSCI